MSMPSMLFLRQYPYFLGGHLKVFDYLRHVAASNRFEPLLYLTPDSIDTGDLVPSAVRRTDRPVEAGAYFVAGANWRFLDDAGIETGGKLVVNLIQGFRHFEDIGHAKYLSRPAVRICVSEPLAGALRMSGRANGPIVTIPAGIDLTPMQPFVNSVKRDRVFIAGLKNPTVANEIAAALGKHDVIAETSTKPVERREFLAQIASSAITVALPDAVDGFYLPGIESMALRSATIMPMRRGPAAYARHGENCLLTGDSVQEIVSAVMEVRSSPELHARLVRNGQDTAQAHALERERQAFFELLDSHSTETAP